MMKFRTVEGQTVDMIVWQHYGKTQGYLEAVLDANPGLAEYGPILPRGVLIELPDIAPPEPPERVRLWD